MRVREGREGKREREREREGREGKRERGGEGEFRNTNAFTHTYTMNSTKVQNPRRKKQVALLAEPKTPPGVEHVYIIL